MTFRNAEWALRANEEVTRFVETGDCRTPDLIAAAQREAALRAEQVAREEKVAAQLGEMTGPLEFSIAS